MKSSEHINELAAALSKAQSEIQGAIKENTNPFFKSKYADLGSVWAAIREPFARNGLSVAQGSGLDVHNDGKVINILHTRLMHSSGQWLESETHLNPVKDDPQSLGSAITYQRRYQLQAIAGVVPEDDDGQAAVQPRRPTPTASVVSNDPKDFIIPFGQFKKYALKDVPLRELAQYAKYLQTGRDAKMSEATYRPNPDVDAFLHNYHLMMGNAHEQKTPV